MNRKIIISCILALAITGCSRVQTETGALSINSGKVFSNSTLVYASDYIGTCSVPSGQKLDNGGYSISLETLETEITCTKNGKDSVQRVASPVFWKKKYDRARSNNMAAGFIFGGPLALATMAATTPSEPDIEKIGPMYRIYPPYLAVVSKGASGAERDVVRGKLSKRYQEYSQNLPKDCANWNQKDFNALCDPEMINLLLDHERAYLSGKKFEMPKKLPSQIEQEAKREPKGVNQ